MAFSDFKTSFQDILAKIKDRLNTLNTRVTDIETWKSSVGSGGGIGNGLKVVYTLDHVFASGLDSHTVQATAFLGWDSGKDVRDVVVHSRSRYTAAPNGPWDDSFITSECNTADNTIILVKTVPLALSQDSITSKITLYAPW